MILSGTMYVLYVDPSYKDIKQQLAKEVEINGYLEQAKEARGKLDDLESQYKAFPVDADKKLNILLPERIDSLKLIIDVNTVAKRHGLEVVAPVVSSSTVNPKNPEKYIKYTLKFKVTSTYSIFHEFLKDIQKSLALRDFSNVTFTSGVEKDITGSAPKPEFAIFDYQVELTSYALH